MLYSYHSVTVVVFVVVAVVIPSIPLDSYSGGSGSFRGTEQNAFQIFSTGRIWEFTTDRYLAITLVLVHLRNTVDVDLMGNLYLSLQARVQALKKIFPDYEDNAPTMSESAFNRMTYPRWQDGGK